jgi:hypothetical protein
VSAKLWGAIRHFHQVAGLSEKDVKELLGMGLPESIQKSLRELKPPVY